MISLPKKSNGFDQRTLIGFIILIIILYSVFSVIYYNRVKNVFAQSTAVRLDGLATIQKNRTLDYIANNQDSLQVLLRSQDLITLVQNVILNKGTSTSATSGSSANVLLNSFLNNARFDRPGIRNISVLDTNGVVIASTDQTQVGLNDAQQKFFYKGQYKPDVGTFFKDKNGFIGLYLTGPLISNNQHIGVIVLEKDAQGVFALFNDNAGLGTTGQWGLGIKNDNGDGLAVVLGRFNKTPNASLNLTISKTNTRTPIIRAINGEEGVTLGEKDPYGVPVVSATRFISETGWGIILKIPEAEVFQPLTQLRNFLFIVFSLLMALFTVYILNIIRFKYVIKSDSIEQ